MSLRHVILGLALVVATTGLALAQVSPGDMNCDSTVDGQDVAPFVLGLIDPVGYGLAYPACQLSNADFDCDGAADTDDVVGFVDCLLTGNCPPCPTGSCCLPEGTCTVTLAGACTTGVWTMFAVCDPNPCPQPGACCQTGGSCAVTLEAGCTGTWQGAGTDCDPNPCSPPGMVLIPAGEFQMGDSFGEGYPDEFPRHAVYVGAFYMDTYEVTNQQYCDALNWAWAQGNLITVTSDVVYKHGGTSYLYCDTTTSSSDSRITWDGGTFGVTSGKESHPMAMASWYGSVAYANWRSGMQGKPLCYDLGTWECTFTVNGYRLPTEAEWEKAARGGQYDPYWRYPWGDSVDGSYANWSGSGDPFESGPSPWTTPVGFYNGQLHQKADFNWPGSQTTFQTLNSVNGYGLYDVAGNVWEWCNDWYSSSYYGSSPYDNPYGPTSGTSRVVRGGGWYDIAYFCRCAARNGYGTPDFRHGNLGFRLALDSE